MARIIPNENTWVGFATAVTDGGSPGVYAPTAAEISGATDLTGFTISVNATTQGNQLPTPTFESLFETSISGTVQAQFSADFYRDDTTDTAWETLPRGTDGFFIISRYGGQGANNMPITADVCEVWPVRVTSRSVQNMGSNQVMMFQAQCAVTSVPDEAAVVAA